MNIVFVWLVTWIVGNGYPFDVTEEATIINMRCRKKHMSPQFQVGLSVLGRSSTRRLIVIPVH